MNKEQKSAWVYIDGKRKGQMRELAIEKFGEAFLSIEIREGIFIIRISDEAHLKHMEEFTDKYKLCKIEVFPRITFSVYRGKKQLVPANK